jgi:hypothetical protein
VSGVNQTPHRVGADAQKLGSLPDPEMSFHTGTIANAESAGLLILVAKVFGLDI